MDGLKTGELIMVRTIFVRLEGQVNLEWKFTMEDGSIREYHSIENETPREALTDARVTDPLLQLLLNSASDRADDYALLMGADLENCDVFEVEFDGRFHPISYEINP